MKKIVQTTLWVFIVVFCLYYIFTNPQGTAGIVRGFFTGIIDFVKALGGHS
ncbi:hypothetical protein [Cutibacterium granulosum]|jgi:hypothetical protein|uniref:Uncharacterized protein n=3 Tax=Cutibacterium granulosum TaxID=33011 RepID=U1F202_9ACTN|nr:hypothetical protein [Cutibacterium granulosum]ERS33275.1 hypothetical protein HMPREF1275_01475 [Propionibacterium sp. KPL1844]MBX7471979.1 hypothetical protein [Streptomyces sp. MAG02]MDU1779830.1 hypothetical protein [Propionibacterium sp.]ERF57972.1 hypothetical protein H641_01893 [Cutibacterium granulosum DSM 20700]ERF65519.1 hypothetical protein H640_06043 [Cutibacterium granulosum TM11]